MKAAFYTGDKRFSVETVVPPALAPGDVRIAVGFCGICGTDLHVYKGHMDKRVGFRRVIGHEMSGTVAEVGRDVDGIAPDDRVVVRPLGSCGTCPACDAGHSHICHKLNFIGLDSDGAFQDRMTVPAATVHKIPVGMSLLHAALVEPTAVACHATRRSRLAKGENVLVLGGGPIGLLIAMVARHAGGEVVVAEVNETRRAIAEGLGFRSVSPATHEVGPWMHEATGGKGADVVFEVSGSADAARAMTSAAATRGRIAMVAIHAQRGDIDLFQFFWRELEMIGSRVYEAADYDDAIALLAAGAIPAAELVTDMFELDEINRAFAELGEDAKAMKSIIRIGGDND